MVTVIFLLNPLIALLQTHRGDVQRQIDQNGDCPNIYDLYMVNEFSSKIHFLGTFPFSWLNTNKTIFLDISVESNAFWPFIWGET